MNGNLVLPLASFYEVSNFDDDKYSSLMEHVYNAPFPQCLPERGTFTAKTLLRIVVERQCFLRAGMQVEMNLGLILSNIPKNYIIDLSGARLGMSV